ncbi:ABC transporter ATP-binding protein [Candidatus Lokiarchaeum ossiferum]|uniref:ABC transporter ATP-binding protein n=1 Tax=Candidatus Lokiarchaeum ossiferum TaxID=2951803 RepID=UPI00352C65A0
MNMTSSDVLIRLKNLSMQFGSFKAINNLSLDIHRGEIVGFLGPNGAGKSTTMKIMANILRPTSGEVWIRANGELEKMTSLNKDYLLDHLGFLIENPYFYKNSTPRQILTYFAKLKGYPRNLIHDRVVKVIKMVDMEEWIDKKLGTFSKGMRQKIGVVSAFVHDPDIIIFDEPHTGLDPKARREVRDLILKLKELNKTVFLSSHLLYEISEVADRIAIISHGELVTCDTLENLEQMTRNSVIQLEILETSIESTFILKKIRETINSIVEEKDVSYDSDDNTYYIRFDGSPKIQLEILKQLLLNNIDVLEFSVPKAGLLEDLYLQFVSESDQKYRELNMSPIKVESKI